MPSSPHPEPPPLTRQLTRIERRVSLAVVGLIVVGLGLGAYAVIKQRPAAQPTTNPSPSGNPTGNLFTDLFDSAFRPDRGQGNVAIAAVYYYPSLEQALEALTQPSSHQREVATVLRREGANERTLAFYLLIDSVVPQDTITFTETNVQLVDGAGETHPFRDWVKLNTFLPQEPGQVRTASLLLFDATGAEGKRFPGDQAETLTLTIKDLPDAAEREFRWLLRLLPV